MLFSLAMVVAGLLLFGLADRLPTVYPPYITRWVGFFSIFTALISIWIFTESVISTGLLGCVSLIILVIIHLAQTGKTVDKQTEKTTTGPATPWHFEKKTTRRQEELQPPAE